MRRDINYWVYPDDHHERKAKEMGITNKIMLILAAAAALTSCARDSGSGCDQVLLKHEASNAAVQMLELQEISRRIDRGEYESARGLLRIVTESRIEVLDQIVRSNKLDKDSSKEYRELLNRHAPRR